MSRNFGLGSRDMTRAGRTALHHAAARGELSFGSTATIADRWAQAVLFLKESGINRMEHIDRESVMEYGRELADKVEAGELSVATAQNYVSAVNTVMSLATRGHWESVSPTRDCGIEQRSAVRGDAPGALDRQSYGRALDAVRDQLGDRVASVVDLMRELGLRSKEASLLDARAAYREALAEGRIRVRNGTKGGRNREIPITTEKQLLALSGAAQAQGSDRSMIPADLTWREWREGELRDAREIVQEHTGGGLHDLRAAYACERYASLTGWAAPVAGGEIVDRDRDRTARATIAGELGHGRIDVVAEYIGGRR